jgi:hypothetical protein
MLNDKSATRREHAAEALALLGTARLKPHLPAITTAAGAKQPHVRALALVMLAELGPAASPAASVIIVALDDKSSECRNAATYALGQLGAAAKPALPTIAARYSNARDEIERANLARILGTIHAPTVTPLIQSALRDKDLGVQLAVLEGLRASKRAPAKAVFAAVTDFTARAQAEKRRVIAAFGGVDELDDGGGEIVEILTKRYSRSSSPPPARSSPSRPKQ